VKVVIMWFTALGLFQELRGSLDMTPETGLTSRIREEPASESVRHEDV
jgi:hypothetical protein